MPKLWMRRIRIELISVINASMIVIGDTKAELKKNFQELNYVNIYSATKLNDELNITINGSKYASTLKDKGTITVFNLSYATICRIIMGRFYKIKIYAGYESEEALHMIFDGSVAYISNKIHSNHDTECYIVFASDTVAQFSQNRMSLALNSGINLYSAIKYMCLTNGISRYHLDDGLKTQFINETQNLNSSFASILDSQALSQNGTYSLSCDGVGGTVVDVTTGKGKRVITIRPEQMTDGNPTLSSEGLKIKLLPTFDFKVGDILSIDNALIDVSISNADSVTSTFNTNYMATPTQTDQEENSTYGMYMIYTMDYTFQNRGQNFCYNITARALDIIQKITT